MFAEVLAIVLTAIANLLCYCCHSKSLFHGKLRLPKVFFQSNRASHSDKGDPSTYFAFDVLDPDWLVTSFWLNETQLLLLRTSAVLFWAVTLVLEGTTGDGFGSRPQEWFTFFTNWTYVLFLIWAVLGTLLSAAHVQRKAEGRRSGFGDGPPNRPEEVSDPERLEAGPREEAVPLTPLGGGHVRMKQWTGLSVGFLLVTEVNAAATLFLSVFFWALINDYKAPPAIDNLLKHGINNAWILADVLSSRVPFVSYHYQVALWYGTAYLVFMWVYHGLSARWVYWVLDWDRASALALYALLPLMLFAAFAAWYGVAVGRERLGAAWQRRRPQGGPRGGPGPGGSPLPGLEERGQRGGEGPQQQQQQGASPWGGGDVELQGRGGRGGSRRGLQSERGQRNPYTALDV